MEDDDAMVASLQLSKEEHKVINKVTVGNKNGITELPSPVSHHVPPACNQVSSVLSTVSPTLDPKRLPYLDEEETNLNMKKMISSTTTSSHPSLIEDDTGESNASGQSDNDENESDSKGDRDETDFDSYFMARLQADL